MPKRPADLPVSPHSGLKNRSRETADEGTDYTKYPPEMGEFEDNYEDEYEEDEEVLEAGDEDDEEGGARIGGKSGVGRDSMEIDQQVYMPSRRVLGKDEILEPDPTAYHMLHSMNVNWPCLSFDVLQDGLGDERRGYPQMVYLVAGTQAARAKDNEVTVMKLSGLQRMQQSKEDEDEDDDASDTEDDPILESRSLQCPTTTNRIRASPHAHHAASMAETGDVYIWDLSPHYRSLESPGAAIPTSANKPTATLKMHRHVEGYAIDWSSNPRDVMGRIATGDNSGKIFISTRKEGGTWSTDSSPLKGHTGSIEELQWSPNERHVFASASSDGTVKIYDARAQTRKHQLSVDVSSSDVNVASWCREVPHLLATGADDGVWGVWDLRTFPNTLKGEHVSATASFTFHQQPITSVEFHPTEDSIVSVASADSTITLWDLSVELDDEESKDSGGVEDIPPQLLFVHYHKDVKEVHWQKQVPGVVIGTGGEGFSVFKTISV
ncbi:WD40-repeat-containing domain protein [Tuber brumale]|nr:WD40-repeat-containing domain protein [Tuber brumale]